MLLQTKFNGQFYNFEVNTFRDDAEQRLYFLIQLTDGGFMLAEKRMPKGKWFQVSGGAFAGQLQDAIFEKIDATSFLKLVADARPFDDLNEFYFKSQQAN